MFIYDQLCGNLLNAFSNYFKLVKTQKRHITRGYINFTLHVPRVNTETYGSNFVKIKAIKNWNKNGMENCLSVINKGSLTFRNLFLL